MAQPRVKIVIPHEAAQSKLQDIKKVCQQLDIPETEIIRKLNNMLRGWMIYYRCVNAPSRVMCSVLSHAWWIYAEYVSRKNGCSIAHAAKRWIDRCPASSLNPKGGQKTWYAETTNDKGEMVREYLLTTPVPKRSLHDVATQILYGVQTPFKAK